MYVHMHTYMHIYMCIYTYMCALELQQYICTTCRQHIFKRVHAQPLESQRTIPAQLPLVDEHNTNNNNIYISELATARINCTTRLPTGTHMYKHMRTFVHVYICIIIYTCIYMCLCACTNVCVCMYLHTYMCVYN